MKCRCGHRDGDAEPCGKRRQPAGWRRFRRGRDYMPSPDQGPRERERTGSEEMTGASWVW